MAYDERGRAVQADFLFGLRMQADDEVQSRYDELADRNTLGTLTPEEKDELAALVRANTLLGVLKAEAHAFLQRPNAA